VPQVELRPEQRRALYRGVVAGAAVLAIGLPVGALVTSSDAPPPSGTVSGSGPGSSPSPNPEREPAQEQEERRVLRVREVGPFRSASAAFALEFDGKVSRRQRDELVVVITSWVERGVRGAFGGEPFELASEVEFLDDGRIVVASWIVDMGEADEGQAVEAITKKLERFLGKQDLPAALLLLGEDPEAGA